MTPHAAQAHRSGGGCDGEADSGMLRVAFHGVGSPLVARQSFPLPLRRKHKQARPRPLHCALFLSLIHI